MYNIDNQQDGYCLSYYVDDRIVNYYEPYVLAHQIIPYCLRSSIIEFNFNNTIDPSFTFAELKENNINSEMLLSWSATIDLAENYQIFLDNPSNLSSGKEEIFYNCTSPWFGPLCNFAFETPVHWSFNYIVHLLLRNKIDIKNGHQITCYIHLKCDRSLCLDWREICDKKVDCSDGSDEYNCWQLEINECNSNEYRCYNGQCIPSEFVHDILLNPDCLDGTDEGIGRTHPSPCFADPAFRCEEKTCRPGEEDFPCGDGQCTTRMSKCKNGRDNISLDNLCLIATACLTNFYEDPIDIKKCRQLCADGNCIKNNCPSLYEYPSGPILFEHVRLIYKNQEKINPIKFFLPYYICYNEQLCKEYLPATIYLNDLSCRYFHELDINIIDSHFKMNWLLSNIQNRFRGCLIMLNETSYCNYSTMYQCINSTKCISKYHLVNGIQDCPFNDDETFNQSCLLNDIHHRFLCYMNNNNTSMCLSILTLLDRKHNCIDGRDEFQKKDNLIENHIYFQTICDGKTELKPILIDGKYETDETECEYWSCNNTYSRCDGHVLCQNGADEINCPISFCPQFEQSCIYFNDTSKVSCLPMEQFGNGNVDCIGSLDERNQCWKHSSFLTKYDFQCWNDTTCISQSQLCNHKKDCLFGDDEIFCKNYDNSIVSSCGLIKSYNRTSIENYFCNVLRSITRQRRVYFMLKNMPIYSFQQTNIMISKRSIIQTKNELIQHNKIIDISYLNDWICNRGLRINIRNSSNTSNIYCLCPPSYYGDKCQYQNQRVSLTLQIQVTSDWRNLFVFLIILIDNQGIIQSHDYIEYLCIRDCDTKFNIYLLYSNRLKNLSKNYYIQIHAFNKLTLKYRSSWIFSLKYPFLPVQRLSLLLIVPFLDIQPLLKCSLSCIHGQCYNYINNLTSIFCMCKSGWSGIHCNIKYTCKCALDSLCFTNNICICSYNRYGNQCYFRKSSCYSNICMNNGQCISNDERYNSIDLKKQICICNEGYTGEYCQYEQIQNRIDISFHYSLNIPSSLLIHLIKVKNTTEHIRMSMMKKISFDENLITFYTSFIYNIAFVEIFNNYYLIILQEQPIISIHIYTQINPFYRCLSLNELFNKTFFNQHLLKRIKYYHIPCKKEKNLICFYDSNHICLCDLNRQTNCFEFDHNITYNCRGYNLCENNGQCFQDNQTCPTLAICSCLDCYYGSKCQFSTKGLSLSLDIILGYRIRQNININQQPIIVKISISLTIIILFLGLINNLFSYITFRNEETQNVGCGIYLFILSIISIITINIFVIKLLILIISQMNLINNRLFLYIQCIIIDFILRSLLSIGDWLNACVAIERTINVLHGVYFNKKKSKQIAKKILFIIFILIFLTYIHDPIHRYLIDDIEEKRIWCVVKYSQTLQIYDWIINIFHFSIPSLINCISALIIIIIVTRNRSLVQKQESYKKILREQFQHHKHLLISPCILIILAFPRLIISFLSGCIKSAQDSWFYLIIYFISFIPSMTTFIVFVLPSKMYKKEFSDSIKHLWQKSL